MNSNLSDKCPHCGSSNLASEPVYSDTDEWDDETEQLEENYHSQVAIFCITCGHFIGEIKSELRGKTNSLHSSFLKQYFNNPSTR